ncbi:MAG: M23 family metallopeptidase [Myxococcaceae bacterium]|nr:M23 family metallopeptidase [Myxococcaceae bacterium]
MRRLAISLGSIMVACASAPVERLAPEDVLGARARPPTREPVASAELLERLQRFVEGAERMRDATPRGAPMPDAHVTAWVAVLSDVEALTGRQASALDLVRARLWLQTAIEADGARYGDVPLEVASHSQRTLAALTMKLVKLSRGNRPLKARPETFVWPVEPVVVTSPWGHRTHPVHGDYRFHAGVDLEANRAQAVYAAGPGVVAFAGWNSGHGKQVELQHDPHLASRYSHLSGWAVQPGDVVKRGDVIGWAGKTGTATGVHLHFELRRDGESLDPEAELPGPGGGLVVTR